MQQLSQSSVETPSSLSALPIPRPTITSVISNAARTVWHLLIFRDHWQGEFATALCGGVGFAFLCLMSPKDLIDTPRYFILGRVSSEVGWGLYFLFFGILQLSGLRITSSWLRLSGALGLFVGFACVFMSLLLTDVWTLGLSAYLTCICVEFCATVYQTAHIVRYREYPKCLTGKLFWRWPRR